MTAGSVLLGIAVLSVVVLFLARPFLTRRSQQVDQTERQALLERKEAFLDEIQALDFDHETGKLPSDIYDSQRAQLISRSAQLLRELDELEGHATSRSVSPQAAADGDAIEAAIARYRQNMAVKAQNGKSRYCTQCGKPSDPGDRFCAYCGNKLASA